MNPNDCPSRDWRLYFNHTLMMHDTRGMVEVMVEQQQLSARGMMDGDKRWEETMASTLRCLWFPPGAINTLNNRAYYIGRRARRQAQQSATLHHYYTVWGSAMNMGSVNKKMLYLLLTPDFPPIHTAIDSIMCEERRSVAISRDLIIGPELLIINKGQEVGKLVEQSGEFRYEPTLERDPLSKRAAFKLSKEGILCL